MTPILKLGDMLTFCGRLVGSVRYTRPRLHDVLEQTWRALRLGWLPVVAFMAPIGLTFAFNMQNVLGFLGARPFAGGFLAPLVVRLLGATLVAVVVTVVICSAFAADIGARKIHGELDASEVMGVNTLARLAIPRAIGLAIACPVLTFFGQLAALAGGYVMLVVLLGENPGAVVDTFTRLLNFEDIFQSSVKSIVFGVVLGFASCYFGYQSEGGPAGVAVWVRRSVIFGIAAVFVLEYLMASLFLAVG